MDHRMAARLDGGRSKLINIAWPYDKYPDMKEFLAHAKITVLEGNGPGMLTNLHATSFYKRGSHGQDQQAGDALWLTVYYNHEEKPSVDMPLMDFFADASSRSDPFATVYFSKVKHSHNLYMVMPYREHIKVEIENRSDYDLFGYMTIQAEEMDRWDAALGHLTVDWRQGRIRIPEEKLLLLDIQGKGALAAHWLELEADCILCKNGEYLCEGNDEIYVDGETEPSHECLGTEDFYGYSWGFHGVQSDGRAAITHEQELPHGGVALTMLRCRLEDRISFQKGMRLVINYQHEYYSSLSANRRHTENMKVNFFVKYRSACYCYQMK